MKKKSYIEIPIAGLKRLRFPPTGYKLFNWTKAGLEIEPLYDNHTASLVLGGDPVGIIINADNLRTIQVGKQLTSLLTFEPASFRLSITEGAAHFQRLDADNNPRDAFVLDLSQHRFFLLGQRRNSIEVWIPRSAVAPARDGDDPAAE